MFTHGPHKAKVRDTLQSYIDQADNKEEINLIDLAKDCTDLITTLFEEDDLIIHPDYQHNLRVTGLSFTKDDNGGVQVNLETIPL